MPCLVFISCLSFHSILFCEEGQFVMNPFIHVVMCLQRESDRLHVVPILDWYFYFHQSHVHRRIRSEFIRALHHTVH